MKPGSSVASPRSITSASAGTARFEPAAVMRLPLTTMTALRTSVSDEPSNKRAAFRTMGRCCALAENAQQATSARKNFFIARRLYVIQTGERASCPQSAGVPPGDHEDVLSATSVSPHDCEVIGRDARSPAGGTPALLLPEPARRKNEVDR